MAEVVWLLRCGRLYSLLGKPPRSRLEVEVQRQRYDKRVTYDLFSRPRLASVVPRLVIEYRGRPRPTNLLWPRRELAPRPEIGIKEPPFSGVWLMQWSVVINVTAELTLSIEHSMDDEDLVLLQGREKGSTPTSLDCCRP